MRLTSPLGLLSVLTAVAMTSLPSFAAAPLGDFEDHADVGSPKVAGSAQYDNHAQVYTLTAGGSNLWGSHDEFQYAWKKLTGDFILRARVQFVSEGGDPHRKLGWQIRPSLDPDAPNVDVAAHGDGEISLQFRHEKGGPTRQFVLPIQHADVLQIERRGHSYIVSAARYGDPFVTSQIDDLDLGDDVYGGLFLCAHSPSATVTAAFRDVRLVKPPKPGYQPYRDYIGSYLEVLDVESGKLERIYKSSEPFEAPNWTRDGSALIYNVSGNGPAKGVLRRFDLATRKPVTIETGTAVHNNNDHVLSFDGSMLGISNQGPENNNRSAVYVVPTVGGTPRQITQRTPSYFHGWSPDGQTLVYTGGRPEEPGKPDVYSIYKIALQGGEETRLTRGAMLDDGPEYSPDGKYIYFNSTRSGRMQLWRMKPDGSDLEQITGDNYNNWFPPISPDGKWIAFISFSTDVPANDHPYYKQVYLRVMPVEMGAPRIVAYVYGGQGTMNVPSWSPDSKRIAFVSNSDFQ